MGGGSLCVEELSICSLKNKISIFFLYESNVFPFDEILLENPKDSISAKPIGPVKVRYFRSSHLLNMVDMSNYPAISPILLPYLL